MKKLTIIVILAGVILLLVPPVLGMQAHSRLQEAMTRAAAQSGAYLDLALEDYDSGWFSSSGKIRLRFSDAYIDSNPVLQQQAADGSSMADSLRTGLAQNIDIAHGPLLFGAQAGLALGEVVATLDGSTSPEMARILATTGNDYFLRSSMVIGFTGLGDIAVDAPAFHFTDTDAPVDTMVFAGATAIGSIDLADPHIVVDGQMNGLSLTGGDGEAVIERTTFSADMAYPETDPYGLGSGRIALDRMVAMSGAQTALDIRRASVAFASSKTAADRVSLELTYAIDKLTTADMALSDMEIGFEMANLDAASLIKMQDFGNRLATQGQDPEHMLTLLVDPAYELVAGGATLSFDPIRFTYKDRPFHAAVLLRTKPGNLPPRAAFNFDNPLQLLTLFAVDVDLSIDRALAAQLAVPEVKRQLAAGVPPGTEIDDVALEQMARAQAPMMMSTLVGQGIFREDGSNYIVSAKYDNGTLLVNGNPFPLGAMFGGGAAAAPSL